MMVNLFLGLGIKAWLLVGSSITDGLSSFPLTFDGEYKIWYHGQPYRINEPHNPIKVVSAIVSSEEMWFNVQKFDEPYRIVFDLSNGRLWKPFFGKTKQGSQFESVQPERLNYVETNKRSVTELETRITNRLTEKLQEWRKHKRTRFYRYSVSVLRDILAEMEKNKEMRDDQTIIDARLADLLKSYRVSGFPLNMPYTSMDAILEAVHATQVHAIPSNDIEYIIAVNIIPYPNTVLSVWIYIAVLSKR